MRIRQGDTYLNHLSLRHQPPSFWLVGVLRSWHPPVLTALQNISPEISTAYFEPKPSWMLLPAPILTCHLWWNADMSMNNGIIMIAALYPENGQKPSCWKLVVISSNFTYLKIKPLPFHAFHMSIVFKTSRPPFERTNPCRRRCPPENLQNSTAPPQNLPHPGKDVLPFQMPLGELLTEQKTLNLLNLQKCPLPPKKILKFGKDSNHISGSISSCLQSDILRASGRRIANLKGFGA